MLKKITIISLIIVLFLSITTQVFADTPTLQSIVDGADSFINEGDDNNLSQGSIKQFSDLAYKTLLIIGIIASIIVGIILGVKIVTAGAEEKAQVKETLIPYFVGVFILFSAFGIWKLVVTLLQ